MTKKKLANWWKIIFFLLLGTMAATMIGYSSGANSVKARGQKINIDRSQDQYVFKVNEKYALKFAPKYPDAGADLITYKPSPAYLSFLGKYDVDKTLMNGVSRSGDWFYYEHPAFRAPGDLIAVNIATGEEVKKVEPVSQDMKFFSQNLTAKGLSQNRANFVKAEQLATMEELSVPKESAITLVMAFGILLILWLLVLPFAFKKVAV